MSEPARILQFPVATPQPAKSKRRRSKLPDFLRAHEFDNLLQVAAREVESARQATKNNAARRDEFVLHIGLFCGLRVSEICDLDIEHIDLGGKRLFVCEGKGGKDRYVPIPERISERLGQWIDGRKTGPLILTERGERICPRTIDWRLARIGRLAGLNRRLHCHLLRHAYAMRLLETGADIRQIQALLGHSTLFVTSQYLHCDTSKLQATVDRL